MIFTVIYLQRLSPDSMETLLDRHLATFDRWLCAHFKSLTTSSWSHYYPTVVTLVDQLDPKEFRWAQVSVILQRQVPGLSQTSKFLMLFGGRKLNIEFAQIVSKFLMDRDRAGCLWVNSHNYADLATPILEILRDS